MCIICGIERGGNHMNNQEKGKILIIPEQYAMLQEQYAKALAANAQQVEAIKSILSEPQDMMESLPIISSDTCDKVQRNLTLATLRANKQILSNYTLVDTYSQDVIDIGTRFQMLIKSAEYNYVEDAILIHKRVTNEPVDLFISCDTTIGIMLKGHKVGDIIQYKDNFGAPCTAEVLYIYADRLGHKIEETEKLR